MLCTARTASLGLSTPAPSLLSLHTAYRRPFGCQHNSLSSFQPLIFPALLHLQRVSPVVLCPHSVVDKVQHYQGGGATFLPSARANSGLRGACQGGARCAEPQARGRRRAPVERDARRDRALGAGAEQRGRRAPRQGDEVQLRRAPPVRRTQAAPCRFRPACRQTRFSSMATSKSPCDGLRAGQITEVNGAELPHQPQRVAGRLRPLAWLAGRGQPRARPSATVCRAAPPGGWTAGRLARPGSTTLPACHCHTAYTSTSTATLLRQCSRHITDIQPACASQQHCLGPHT